MVEEGEIQTEVPPKRIRLDEIREDEDEDRISQLPDCSLVEIVSRLPDTKYAIRTGALSKRWKHVWTLVPVLFFQNPDIHLSAGFVSFVDKTLTQRGQMKLKEFMICTRYNHQFEAQIRSWIRYAINCNVEKIYLAVSDPERECVSMVDQCFFINSCFTHLMLSFRQLNPTGAISWKNLRRLCISQCKLDEDLIENILSGSPVLESLILNHCYGFRRLNITSKSVEMLRFYGYIGPSEDVVEINAPNILSLEIQFDLYMRKLLLINVSALVEADLDYWNSKWGKTVPKEAEEEMLKGLILSLRHVKKLNIGSACLKVLSRLKAKGFSLPSNLTLSGDLPEVSSDRSDDSDSPESRDNDGSDDSDSPESRDSDGSYDTDSDESRDSDEAS